jgi:PKD repeat protein
MTTQTVWQIAARGALAVLVMATTGCELGREGAPPLSGPSSLGLDVLLTATPDRLFQDGVSKTTITAVVRDASGEPVVGLPLEWGVRASDGTFIEPSWRFSPTDANGGTSVIVTAPAAPETLPTSPVVLTVSATPVSGDSANSVPRQVTVQLVSPEGTPPVNNLPVASFVMAPSTAGVNQVVTFDASASTDEGVPCRNSCFYTWDFADGTTASGMTVTHAFTVAGTYAVTLTVRDSRDGVGRTTRSIVVTSTLAALFTFSPTDPVVGDNVNFDATGSIASMGATISSYTWDFGDGMTATGVKVSHPYGAARTYVASLTIMDSQGQSATVTRSVTVKAP